MATSANPDLGDEYVELWADLVVVKLLERPGRSVRVAQLEIEGALDVPADGLQIPARKSRTARRKTSVTSGGS